MTHEILFAGFGGQGILSMGKFLAYGGMDAGYHVSWCPSYGPEMRGGTANCAVIISDEDIGAPVVNEPDVLVVMNRPSYDRFEKSVKPGGLVIADGDLIDRPADRRDIETLKIPAQTLAKEIGSSTIANMILLGALIEKTGLISIKALLDALRAHGKESFFDMNMQAVQMGEKAAMP